MTTFELLKNEETTRNAGAQGFFQIETLKDYTGEDVTDQVDQNEMFPNEETLKDYLAPIFNLDAKDIDFIYLDDNYNEGDELHRMGLDDEETEAGFDWTLED